MCAYQGRGTDTIAEGRRHKNLLAEVDGNRTRQTRFTRLNRFEDGEAHQALGHLRC